MNNNVTDIFQALKNLEGKISSLEKTVDDQQECICNLTRINDRLRKENHILKNRLAKYESPYKDSNNSSVPPSKERMSDEVKRRTKTLRKPTGRKPEGQFGHYGKLKIKLKNSGTFWSELGADAFLELHSIVETAKKHDLSPYKAIRALWRCTDSYGIR